MNEWKMPDLNGNSDDVMNIQDHRDMNNNGLDSAGGGVIQGGLDLTIGDALKLSTRRTSSSSSIRTEKAPRGPNNVKLQSLNFAGPTNPKTFSLRQWIKHALHMIGDKNGTRAALSSSYLECCIRIAIPLTEQIIKAEKLASYGITDKLDLLPINSKCNWAEYTTIYLKDHDRSERGDDQKMPAKKLEVALDSGEGKSATPDTSKQTNIFPDSFGVSNAETPMDTKQSSNSADGLSCNMQLNSELNELSMKGTTMQNYNWASNEMIGLNGHDHACTIAESGFDELHGQLRGRIGSFDAVHLEDVDGDNQSRNAQLGSISSEGDRKHLSQSIGGYASFPVELNDLSPNSSRHTGVPVMSVNSSDNRESVLNCLNIKSAQIKCPETPVHGYNDDSTGKGKLQRIYYLGLLLYELFSGGEVPPANLLSLASSSGAFISLPTLTLVKTLDKELTFSNEPKRRQGPAGPSLGLCKLSFEYLKFMGIPGPICHLIFNMLDSVYGDLRSNETYNSISEVTLDLKLMLDKPNHLRGLDTNNTSPCLQLGDISILREEELQSIESCYQRSLSGSCELVIIKGESGSGKTWLAQKVGSLVIEKCGLFLMGKFDRLQQQRPFSALASAFDQYCDLLLSQRGSDWANAVLNNLQSALGSDASHLVNVIPKLGQIMHDTTFEHNSSDSDYNCRNAMERIHYLLCRFVEVINASSMISITLFLDDLQWADEASIFVLNRLLSQARSGFFFLGCCRDDEMGDGHPFWKVFDDASNAGINTTAIDMKCLTEDVLNTVISDLLHLSPRVVKSLSSLVYNKTRGNPLFVSQLLLSLSRDGLLRVDLKSQRWVWDQEKIYSAKLPDNVAICFINGIRKLPIEVQLALHNLSMFGARIKYDCLSVLEIQLGMVITEPLKNAATEGLVSIQNGSCYFCHDRIQETCYNLIQEHHRRNNHLIYGRCLVNHALETGNDDMLFTAVNQINNGGPSAITDEEDYFTMANHNLTAGKKAMAMSDFSSAYSFFDNGISFLREIHWRHHYAFSLEMHELAARCALATGNIQDLHIHAEQLLQNANCFEDTLNMHYTITMSMMYASKLSEALEKGLEIVSQLGEDIPTNPTEKDFAQQVQHTQAMIKGISENDFMNYQIMTDRKKLAVMKFLCTLWSLSFIVNPALHPFIALKLVDLTVLHGLAPQSPNGLAMFGVLLAKIGSIKVGYRFAMLAMSLLQRPESKEVAGEVIFVVSRVKCYVEPLQALNEFQTQGQNAAISAGDVHMACTNRFYCCLNLLWSGAKLADVEEEILMTFQFAKKLAYKTNASFILSVQQTVLTLMGREPVTPSQAASAQRKNNREMMHLTLHNLYVSLILDNDDIMECCETLCEFEKKIYKIHVPFNDQNRVFFVGLAAFRVYRQTRNSLWLERGRHHKDALATCVNQGCIWNFQQKLHLLEAEEAYCIGNVDYAKVSYNNAIAKAQSHKFLNEEALAYDLAAKFYFEIGDLRSSFEHFRLSHEKYSFWGAVKKANLLFEFINSAFPLRSSDPP